MVVEFIRGQWSFHSLLWHWHTMINNSNRIAMTERLRFCNLNNARSVGVAIPYPPHQHSYLESTINLTAQITPTGVNIKAKSYKARHVMRMDWISQGWRGQFLTLEFEHFFYLKLLWSSKHFISTILAKNTLCNFQTQLEVLKFTQVR